MLPETQSDNPSLGPHLFISSFVLLFKKYLSTILGQKLCPVSQGEGLLPDPVRVWRGRGNVCREVGAAHCDPTTA